MKYLPLLCFFVIFSCGKVDENSAIDPLLDFEEKDYVKGRRLSSSSALFKSNDLMIIENYLVVHDPDLQMIFKVIDITEDTFLTTFGPRGEGPCELSPLSFMNRYGVDGKMLGIYNALNQSFQEYSFDDIIQIKENLNCIQSSFKLKDYHLSITKLDSDYYLGYLMSEEPFSVIRNGNIIRKLGNHPFRSLFPEVPAEVLTMAYQCRLIKHPTDSRILSTSQYSFNMELLKWDRSGNFEIYKSMHFWPPEFEFESGDQYEIKAPIKAENRFGNVSTTVSQNFIYVLYSDEPWNYQFPMKSKRVLVYDWDGNPIRVLELDQESSMIAVHEKDEFLIGYVDDGKANLFKFDL
jgi:hypothetical protein